MGEDKIKKINKNYYRIHSRPFCSVFLDEKLMKKANKILYKYKQEIDSLLKNNPEHLIEQEWSLVYPNGKQESFYGTNLTPVEDGSIPGFKTIKVNNLYFIGKKNIYSKEVEKAVEKLLT